MKTVKVRNIEIGAGKPKICVPIVGKTFDEIIESAKNIVGVGADLVEWRVDWYENIFDIEKTIETAKKLKEVLGDTPILFTFRTSKEGGEKSIETEDYVSLNCKVASSKVVDLVDVEVFTGDDEVRDIVKVAHENGVFVVGSNHDFDKTPEKNDIISRLEKMQELDVDIPKIAVMPNSKRDVLTLLMATEEMASDKADRPIVTMSMKGMGSISRICGEVFGSSITFGTVGKASAPGQIDVENLSTAMDIIHDSL